MMTDIYVASCVETGGIYHYKMIDDTFSLVHVTRMDRPMYMIIEKQKMYIVLRAPFENGESGVVVYDINEDGELVNPSEIMSTKGEVACHIVVHNEQIYCANYISGSVIMLPDKVVQHEGCGMHPKRQEGPHVHFVGVTPDNQFICATDLGLDTIYIYNLDLTLHSVAKVPSGHGVRHLAFSEDGKFLFSVNELESTVAMFSYHLGELKLMSIESAVPSCFTGETTASAIRIRDGKIYVSNRGHDSIAVLQYQNDSLKRIENIDCGGKTPRDFIFVHNYLMCANQDSNQVSILNAKDKFKLLTKLEVQMPICVCVGKR